MSMPEPLREGADYEEKANWHLESAKYLQVADIHSPRINYHLEVAKINAMLAQAALLKEPLVVRRFKDMYGHG